MKDFYYILGVNESASADEIKKAYRKLSLKFHPDKNEGDPFFTERFKDIQEAYEILVDPINRKEYDTKKTNNSEPKQPGNNGANFIPIIEYFRADKSTLEFNEQVTFSWKTINANRVIINPFGPVEPIGKKTYIIKDFKNPSLHFEIIAVNTNISRQIKSSLSLKNKTYQELYEHFKIRIESENAKMRNQNSNNSFNNVKEKEDIHYQNKTNRKDIEYWIVIIAVSGILFILFLSLLSH